jgi:hypothetical protein
MKRKRIFLKKVTMKIINEDQKQKGSIKTMKVKGRKSKLPLHSLRRYLPK